MSRLRPFEKHEVSKGLLAKIKFRGGAILVNDQPQNATYLLDIGDRVIIDIPAEEGFETLEAIERPLDILYEDDHFLVLNKPYGVASIPSVNHSNTIAFNQSKVAFFNGLLLQLLV